ncbi:hypothetical protein Barb6_02786 [Bacteroidales bacterium Barb6]|nr:hypothetical protein Barb6_02786 [Bacteroidales bacterium Barb6]
MFTLPLKSLMELLTISKVSVFSPALKLPSVVALIFTSFLAPFLNSKL